MPAAPALDKTVQSIVRAIESELESIKSAAACDDPKTSAEISAEHKALAKKLDAAKAEPAAKVAAALQVLLKEAKAKAKAADARSLAAYFVVRRRQVQAEYGALLMKALVMVGKIDDPVLAKAALARQQALRDRMNAIEKIADAQKAFGAMDELWNKHGLSTLEQTMAEAVGMGQWVRGTYRPAAARAAAAARAVPEARCQKALAQHIEAAEAAKNRALAAMDLGAAKGTTIGMLARIERVSAKVRAVGPAIDRELERIDTMLKQAGSPKAAAESLRALRMHKAGGWPKGGTLDEIEREVGAFEAAVTRFAALAAKEAAAAAKAVKSA